MATNQYSLVAVGTVAATSLFYTLLLYGAKIKRPRQSIQCSFYGPHKFLPIDSCNCKVDKILLSRSSSNYHDDMVFGDDGMAQERRSGHVVAT